MVNTTLFLFFPEAAELEQAVAISNWSHEYNA